MSENDFPRNAHADARNRVCYNSVTASMDKLPPIQSFEPKALKQHPTLQQLERAFDLIEAYVEPEHYEAYTSAAAPSNIDALLDEKDILRRLRDRLNTLRQAEGLPPREPARAFAQFPGPVAIDPKTMHPGGANPPTV